MVGIEQKLGKILRKDSNKLYPNEQEVIIYSSSSYAKIASLTR